MAVRNWWIEADIDGRQTSLEGGPRNREGGFSLRIYQRDEGSIRNAGYIRGMVNRDGMLVLEGSIDGQQVKLITHR